MPAISTPYRRAFSSGFALALCGACATYVEEPISPGMAGLTAGSGGDAAEVAGSGGSEPTAMAGSGGSGATAGSGTSGDAASGASGAAGTSGGMGGGGMGGAGGVSGGGAGGVGGKGGSGGKAGSGGSGGSAGAGGSGAGQTCAMRQIPAKSSWKLAASHSQANNAQPVSNTHDNDLNNRWSTGKDQFGDESLQIDFGMEVQITRLTLVLGSSVNDYPRMYQTRISNTANDTASQPLASGSGQASTDTIMSFPKGTRGRFVRISQHGSATGLWWSVAEIQAECAD